MLGDLDGGRGHTSRAAGDEHALSGLGAAPGHEAPPRRHEDQARRRRLLGGEPLGDLQEVGGGHHGVLGEATLGVLTQHAERRLARSSVPGPGPRTSRSPGRDPPPPACPVGHALHARSHGIDDSGDVRARRCGAWDVSMGSPRRTHRSRWFMDAASTSMRTSPGPGSGTGSVLDRDHLGTAELGEERRAHRLRAMRRRLHSGNASRRRRRDAAATLLRARRHAHNVDGGSWTSSPQPGSSSFETPRATSRARRFARTPMTGPCPRPHQTRHERAAAPTPPTGPSAATSRSTTARRRSGLRTATRTPSPSRWSRPANLRAPYGYLVFPRWAETGVGIVGPRGDADPGWNAGARQEAERAPGRADAPGSPEPPGGRPGPRRRHRQLTGIPCFEKA